MPTSWRKSTDSVAYLENVSQTDEGKNALNTAYQWNALEVHDDTFYDPFRQVLQAAGLSVRNLMK